jgi:hypothetical protein
MTLLWVLLLKDLRRALRNPVGWLVFLALPLLITALPGLVFSPRSSQTALGKVRLALVDEDETALTQMLRGAANQGRAGESLELHFVARDQGLVLLNKKKVSAMLVIPAGFTREYLSGTNAVCLELIKNPAESIYPALIEELTSALVAGLDGVKRNFGHELPEIQRLFSGEADYKLASQLVNRIGDRISASRDFLVPPRVSYTSGQASAVVTSGVSQSADSKATVRPRPNVFGYILPGIAAMFLLFIAESSSRDIQREFTQHTIQRFESLHQRLYTLVAAKMLFNLIFLLLCSTLLLGLGGMVFGIHWSNPVQLIILTVSYCAFAAGLMSLLPPILGFRRESAALGNILGMFIGLAGGSAFPPDQLPGFLRGMLTEHLPNYWYAEAVRASSFGSGSVQWQVASLKMILLGGALMLLSAVLLQWRLRRSRT